MAGCRQFTAVVAKRELRSIAVRNLFGHHAHLPRGSPHHAVTVNVSADGGSSARHVHARRPERAGPTDLTGEVAALRAYRPRSGTTRPATRGCQVAGLICSSIKPQPG